MVRPQPGTKVRAAAIGLAVFGLTCAVLMPMVPAALANGDAAVYAQQIEQGDLSARTTHLGFYLIGSVGARVLLGFSDYAFNMMNVLLAACTLSLAALLTYYLVGSAAPALLTGLLLIVNLVVADSSVFAEVYMAQALFLLLALGLWQAKQSSLSAGAFAFATLVSPSSLFAVPSFVILRPSVRPLVLFGSVVGALLTLAILPVYDDFVFSERGLLRAAATRPLGMLAVLKEAYEVVFGFLCLLPFALLGLSRALRTSRLRGFGLAALSLWLVSFLLGEKFQDVPVQLPFYLLLGVLAGVEMGHLLSIAGSDDANERGTLTKRIWLIALMALVPIALILPARLEVKRLAELPGALPLLLAGLVLVGALVSAWIARRGSPRRAVLALISMLLAATGIFMVLMTTKKSARLESYRDSVLEIRRLARPDFVVVGGWSQGVLYNHYVSRTAYSDEWLNVEWLRGSWGAERQLEARGRWEAILGSDEDVWLLGDHPELAGELVSRGFTVERVGETYRASRKPEVERTGGDPGA